MCHVEEIVKQYKNEEDVIMQAEHQVHVCISTHMVELIKCKKAHSQGQLQWKGSVSSVQGFQLKHGDTTVHGQASGNKHKT